MVTFGSQHRCSLQNYTRWYLYGTLVPGPLTLNRGIFSFFHHQGFIAKQKILTDRANAWIGPRTLGFGGFSGMVPGIAGRLTTSDVDRSNGRRSHRRAAAPSFTR